MYFARKLVYLIVRASNQLAVKQLMAQNNYALQLKLIKSYFYMLSAWNNSGFSIKQLWQKFLKSLD